MLAMCGCASRDNIRRDCYWHHCEHDMGASIDCCTLRDELGDCPCADDCKDYISHADANEAVKKYVIIDGKMANKYITETVPNYPLAIEPINSLPFDLPKALADILDGVYTTSDAGEAATLASTKGWIICDVAWGDHPEMWVLGSLKNPG